MRKIAFGYSNRCNIKCAHCVAVGDVPENKKMELAQAKTIIRDLAGAGVSGISFTAGEPLLYFDDMLELVKLCYELKIYTRIVTNSYWAKTMESAAKSLELLSQCGLSQIRLSYSRWHQQNVPAQNVLNAALSAQLSGVDYFVSFVTDFTETDDVYERFLRENNLKFFPEPVIYSGRAESFGREKIFTDYQANCCAMNPYLAPDLNMYACCDAGSHFNTTNFFLLGNLEDHSVETLFEKSENNPLFNCIRSMGITNIASFAGFKSRDIVTYRKCDLCRELFDSPEMLRKLQNALRSGLTRWAR